MKNSKHLNIVIPYMLIAVSAVSAHNISQKIEKPALFINKQQSTLNLDNKFWDIFNLGQKRLISSLYWISTILESDHEHYKNHDLNSWMFLRFNTISILEPLFYENYAFGGPYLSIVKDDLAGASVIYNKGLKKFPKDYNLLRDAGFHFYFEAPDYIKAKSIYERLSKLPGTNPIIISSLARLESSEGNIEEAYKLLLNKYDEIKSKPSLLTIALERNLYALKAEIDLNCLNSHQNICEKKDFEGREYVFLNGKFRAQKQWSNFRIKKKNISN